MLSINKTSISQIVNTNVPSPTIIYLIVKGKALIWFLIYIILNLVVGLLYFIKFSHISIVFGVAKFFASLIMLNSSLLLLCVSTTISTTLSRFFNLILPLGKLIEYHKLIATVFYISAWGHSLSHLIGTFPLISGDKLGNINFMLNHKFTEVPSYTWLLFASLPGITGIALLVLITVMVVISLEFVRKKHFESFWFTHKMYVIIFVLTHFHGMMEIIDKQKFWIWTVGPFSLIILERFIKYYKIFFSYRTKLISMTKLESGVIELIINKPESFKYIPGQYCRICIDSLSKFQYHPFTISSSPIQNSITLHISPLGNWTNEIVKLVNDKKSSNSCDYPSIRLDGPYGAPTQTYYKYNHLMLIASGIGATPFSSILTDLLFRIKNKETEINYEEIDLYWMQRRASQFSWLCNVFNDLVKNETDKIFNFNIFYTNPNQKYDLRSFFLWQGIEILKKSKYHDFFKSNCNIFWGRPDWNELFFIKSQILKKGSKIGVFVCGNDELSREIKQMCVKYSTDKIFHFHKENF